MQKEKFIKELGNHIRKLREERKMTQSEFANLIGRDRQSYQRIELGTTNPTVGYLFDIAKMLGISFKELFDF